MRKTRARRRAGRTSFAEGPARAKAQGEGTAPEDYLQPKHKHSARMGREAAGGDSRGGSESYLLCETLNVIGAESHRRITGELENSLQLNIEEGWRGMDWKKTGKLSGCFGSKKYLGRLALSENRWVVDVGDTSSLPSNQVEQREKKAPTQN